MRKQMMLAAPFVAAVAFVCQPAMSEDRAPSAPADSAVNSADRAIQRAGDAADRTGTAVDAAVRDASDAAQVAGSRQAAMKNMSKDQKFAVKTADMNQFEIQAGRLAAQKAQRDEIKQFGQMMVDDHTKANQKLQQIAQQKNIQISQELSPVHQAMLSDLQQMEGEDFDKAYLYGQVAGHTKAALKLRDAQQELQDQELRAYAGEILPKVKQHLMHAQQMARADEAITAGARMPADAAHGGGAATSGDRTGDATGARSANPSEDTAGGRAERGAAPVKGGQAPGETGGSR